MIDIPSLAPGLRSAEPGLWVADAGGEAEFSEDAHAGCFALEDESFWFQHRNAVLRETVASFPPPGTLFDVGGGNGCVTRALLQAGHDAVLVEPGPEGVRNARSRGVRPIIRSTLEHAGFGDGVLPAVGLFDVLDHLRDDARFLRSLRRVIRADGRLYVAVPALEWLWSDADAGAGHFRRYTRPGLASLLESTGFRVEYATFFFSYLVVPVLLLRTLPSRLPGRKRTPSLQALAEREHLLTARLARPLLQRFIRLECGAVRARRSLPLGSSLLAVGRPA
jgi:SAM-dependent methyltransferase